MKEIVEATIAGQTYSIETGRMAKQADGSCIIRAGDTMVLVTVCSARDPKEGLDFLPLTVDFQERTYAAGRIPGGYFKREARPTEKETLTSRLIDRPLRPLFPEGYRCETQVIAQVISADPEHEGDVLAMTGASAALAVSDIPFTSTIAGVRVCRIDGEFVLNPGNADIERADLEILMAGSNDAIVMVEGGAENASERDMIEALEFGHKHIREFIDLQKKLAEKIGQAKREFTPPEVDLTFYQRLEAKAKDGVLKQFSVSNKIERNQSMKAYRNEVIEELLKEYPEADDAAKAEATSNYKGAFDELKHHVMRQMIVQDKKRIDGRGFEDIRQITCEVGVLPRTHGSALFTRGETQGLVTVTLGSRDDEQRIESLQGTSFKRFLLHYNFPPFSVGEVRMLRGPGRREIGHGKLAERAVEKILPSDANSFPYTIRIVSEILESNGSSSMATVCGSSLALMDAGVAVKDHVAGIAMGLIKEGENVAILSDILGDEDHLGDMDFKVCGTREGITSIQMDIKIAGVTREILEKALEQARQGRQHILSKMEETITQAREKVSEYAPRWEKFNIKPSRIKDVIGSGGKVIKGIVEETGVKIDIEDSGLVTVFSADPKAIDKAVEIINKLTEEAVIGKIYQGSVKRVADFGAFVEIIPGIEGLVHISQLSEERVNQVSDVVNENDEVTVMVIEISDEGKVRLSLKDAVGKGVGEVHEVNPDSIRKNDRPSRGGNRDRGRDRNRGGNHRRGRDRR